MNKEICKSYYKKIFKDLLKFFSVKRKDVKVNYLDIIKPVQIGYFVALVESWRTIEISKRKIGTNKGACYKNADIFIVKSIREIRILDH